MVVGSEIERRSFDDGGAPWSSVAWRPLELDDLPEARALVHPHRQQHLEIDAALAARTPSGDGDAPALFAHRSRRHLDGVALVDGAAYLDCRAPNAASQFAASLARWKPRCAEIFCAPEVADHVLRAWRKTGPAVRIDVVCLALFRTALPPRAAAWPTGELRSATLEDLDIAQAMLRTSIIEEHGFDPAETNPMALRLLAESQLDDGVDHLIVNSGSAVFWASCATATPEWALVEGVVVPPEARGRGWALSGLHQLCSHLLADRTCVHVRARHDNTRARLLYRRLGFEPTGAVCFIHRRPSHDESVELQQGVRSKELPDADPPL